MNDKAMLEGISLENLTWSQEEFSLSDFVDKFPLPQIVKVQEGYYGPDEDSCLGADQILFLHTLKHTEKVQARDVKKRELHIPLNCSQKVEIRPSNLKEAFESVEDLAQVFRSKNIPKFVRVTQGYTSEDDRCCINPGDRLMLIKVVSENGEEYLVVDSNDGFSLQLPLSALARFQPLTDGREYYVKEATNLTPMPFFFQFIKPLNLSDTGEATVFNSTLGVLRAEKTYHDSTVVCTTREGTQMTVVSCPKQLQITVTAASGALIGDKEYMRVCRFFHDGVSLKRIENLECFNVFASRDTIREYQYDEPQTPDSLLQKFCTDDADDSDDSHEYNDVNLADLSNPAFQKFNYEEFKSSFDSERDDSKVNNDEEGDNYEDMVEPPVDKPNSKTPVLYLESEEKKTPPPLKPKPVVKAHGSHHAETTQTKPATCQEMVQIYENASAMTATKENGTRDSNKAQDAKVPQPAMTATKENGTRDTNKAQDAKVPQPSSSKPQDTTSNEVDQMTVSEVSKFLEKHHLSDFIDTFKYNQVDGEMLVIMDLEMMEALGMNKFQQKKLAKLIDGWRPKC